jgi:hypothetical protein
MKSTVLCCWALLLAAPVFSQPDRWKEPQLSEVEPKWFLLMETESEVRARLGQPAMVADFGNYRSWQYQLDEDLDHDDFSHALVFRKSDGRLISISRTYATERNVDAFFPDAMTTVHHFPDARKPAFSIRVRRLSGGRLLMAMGTSKAGQATGQLVLMRESELTHFYPWLEEQLASR